MSLKSGRALNSTLKLSIETIIRSAKVRRCGKKDKLFKKKLYFVWQFDLMFLSLWQIYMFQTKLNTTIIIKAAYKKMFTSMPYSWAGIVPTSFVCSNLNNSKHLEADLGNEQAGGKEL